jgi:hypothetical protein
MAVPNHESFPAPRQMIPQLPDSAKEFPFGDIDRESIDVPAAQVTNELIKKFNKEHGTNIYPAFTDSVNQPKK